MGSSDVAINHDVTSNLDLSRTLIIQYCTSHFSNFWLFRIVRQRQHLLNNMIFSRIITLVLSLLLTPFVAGRDEHCKPFKDIYKDGTELCEMMWSDAFKVVDDSQPGYTMWFFDQENNPNDAVTHQLFGNNTVPDQCHLQYFHKDTPGPEGDDMTECHPWKNNACCNSSTVTGPQQIKEAYGAEYHWDRCGPLSEACERFFVMEACLYECEPSAGLFRKYDKNSSHPDANDWQIHQMPIKKSFCNAWYTACANDYFCGTGDFFACAAIYKAKDSSNSDDSVDTGLVFGLAVAGLIAVLGIIIISFLISREKQGKPMFAASSSGVSS